MYINLYILQVVTIYAKPFVYTREIETEEDEEKCLTDGGIFCSHHNITTGNQYVNISKIMHL